MPLVSWNASDDIYIGSTGVGGTTGINSPTVVAVAVGGNNVAQFYSNRLVMMQTYVYFQASLASASIKFDDRASGTGGPLNISGQGAGTGTGGSLGIASGVGATANGALTLSTGADLRFNIEHGSAGMTLYPVAASNKIVMTDGGTTGVTRQHWLPTATATSASNWFLSTSVSTAGVNATTSAGFYINGTFVAGVNHSVVDFFQVEGSGNIMLGASVSYPMLYQNTTTATPGKTLRIHAQGTTHATGTGGTALITSGAGATKNGDIIFGIGGSDTYALTGTPRLVIDGSLAPQNDKGLTYYNHDQTLKFIIDDYSTGGVALQLHILPNATTPSISNYILKGSGTTGILNGSTGVHLRVADSTIAFVDSSGMGLYKGIAFQASTVSPTIGQNSVSGSNGQHLTISAQGSDLVAGNLILAGGATTGTANGGVVIRTGTTVRAQWYADGTSLFAGLTWPSGTPGAGLVPQTNASGQIVWTTPSGGGVPVGGANQVYWSNGSANSWSGAPTVTSLGASSYLSVGASPALTGAVRLEASAFITCRSSGADRNLIGSDASGGLVLSQSGSSISTPSTSFNFSSSDSVTISLAGHSAFYLGTASLTLAVPSATNPNILSANNTSVTYYLPVSMNSLTLSSVGLLTFAAGGTVTASTATTVVDFQTTQQVTVTLTANTALQLRRSTSGPGVYRMIVKQDATGGRSVTGITDYTAGSVYKPGGTIDIATAANARTLVGLVFDGTDWYITFAQPMQV